MCMMCEDEKAYRAYMVYLDAKEKAGEMADPDKAMDEILKVLEQEAPAAWNCNPWEDDKTLSTHTPFICAPADDKNERSDFADTGRGSCGSRREIL